MPSSHAASRSLSTIVAALLAACADPAPTGLAPAAQVASDLEAARAPGGRVKAPTIVSISVTGEPIQVLGAMAPLTVTLHNPVGATQQNLVLRAQILGPASEIVSKSDVDCGAGTGALPKGTCTMKLPLITKSGQLRPGLGTLVVSLVQGGTTETLLDSESAQVTLVETGPLRIDALTIDFEDPDAHEIEIGGEVPYTVSLFNGAATPTAGVLLQASVEQGGNLYGGGGTFGLCDPTLSVLQPGACAVDYQIAAAKALQPGPATVRLALLQSFPDGVSEREHDYRIVAVTLVDRLPN